MNDSRGSRIDAIRDIVNYKARTECRTQCNCRPSARYLKIYDGHFPRARTERFQNGKGYNARHRPVH